MLVFGRFLVFGGKGEERASMCIFYLFIFYLLYCSDSGSSFSVSC